MNLEKVKTIIRGKGLIIVVKRDNKAPNRKKVFNTLTKCKIKVPKLQNINSFGSVITPLFYLPMATNIPSKWSQFPSYEDIMPKPSHTPLFSETVENLQGAELWGRKRGNRLVWREKGDSTHAEQVSGRELFAGSLWYESYPCTCYMRLSTLVQSQINRQFSDPEHSQGKRNKQKNREARQERTVWQQADHRNQGTSVLQTGKWDLEEWVSGQKTHSWWQSVWTSCFFLLCPRRKSDG